MKVEQLKLATPGDREIVITRRFACPQTLLWRVFTEPSLLRRWMLGPPGWSMPVCEIDLRVGGRYRYEWLNDDGRRMGVRGAFQEVVAPEWLVHSERFDDPWYPGEAQITSIFREDGDYSIYEMRMLLESREGRDQVLKSGMDGGMEQGFQRLDEIFAEKENI